MDITKNIPIQVISGNSNQNSLLWSMTSDLGVSYLFGTMHVRSSVAHQFLDAIIPFMDQCQILAAEMNLDEFDQLLMMQGTSLPAGLSLLDLLGQKKYHKLRNSILKSFSVDLDLYQYRHPFLVSASISESLLVNDQLESLDQEIWNRAKEREKTCLGLESFAEQMSIMQQISIDESVRQIKYIGRNPPRFRRNLHKMIKFYVEQDVINLYKSSRKQLEKLRKKLLFERNVRMTDRLVSLIREQPVFSAVGAAHLAGQKGMLRLIKDHGFKVTPIKLVL